MLISKMIESQIRMEAFVRLDVPFSSTLRVLIIALFVFAVPATDILAAQDAKYPSKSSGPASALLHSYEWYDGRQKRTVWINPDLVVEFRHGELSSGGAQEPIPGLSLQKQLRGVRVWKLDKGSNAEALSWRRDVDRWAHANYAPAFHDTPSSAGKIRSLPGNVIVYLNPEWGPDRAGQWVEQNGYTIVKKLELGANAYILKSGIGIESLRLANKLYESGEVVAAFPDWWLETTTR